jgi:hypothetical protein
MMMPATITPMISMTLLVTATSTRRDEFVSLHPHRLPVADPSKRAPIDLRRIAIHDWP